jgi:hypothetical protein
MMKKLLLGSTALVAGGLLAAPAMAADPIKIGVGGYYQFYAIAGGIESTYASNGSSVQYKGLQFQQEGEIHFIGQSKLDNGTTVGITVELEGWNPATGGGPQIDEAFLFAFGDWGRIEFGSRDPAAYRMFYGAPSALLGWGFFQHNSNFGWASAAMVNNPAFQGATFATIGGQFQDAERINYFTPRFMGLQIGVGYAPKINLTPIGSLAHGATNGPALGAAGACGTNDATTSVNCPTNDWSWQDVFDIGANYLNKFGNVTVAVMGGFMYGSFIPGFQSSTTSLNRATGANLTSWKQWVVGAQFGFAGFTLGGSYGYDNNGLGGNWYTGQDNDTRKFTVGLMYETGPWQMSFGYANSRNNSGNGYFNFATCGVGGSTCTSAGAATTNAAFSNNVFGGAANSGLNFGSTTVSKFELGANYALGPGIKLTGGAIFWNASGNAQSVVGQSWGILMGMDLRF